MLPDYKSIKLTDIQRSDVRRIMQKHVSSYRACTGSEPPSIMDDGAYVLVGLLMMDAARQLQSGDRGEALLFESLGMILMDALSMLRPDVEQSS